MLTVVRADSPQSAKVGLIEAVVAHSEPVGPPGASRRRTARRTELGEFCLVITCARPDQLGTPVVETSDGGEGLISPFDALARTAAGEGGNAPVSGGSADGMRWVSFHTEDATAKVTVATRADDPLSAVDELWHQATALHRHVLKSCPREIESGIEVTLHFTGVRLEEEGMAEALHLLDTWKAVHDGS